MYESFFQFHDRPFAAAPRVDRYFPAASIEHARQTLARAVQRAEGPGLLIGPAGTGKSLLCQLLAEEFRDSFRVAMLACARLCTRRALLQNLLFELGLPYRDMEEGELRLTLIDHLEPSERCPHGMLLVVDEAHVLPLRLLDEIRMITNLVRDGEPRVRLVLAGGALLEERFANPKLESFNQRIAARCYLESLSRDETIAYVAAQINAVGGDPEQVFTDDALRAVHQATDGIPRLINQVCDQALMLASLGRRRQLDAAGVEEAWADLQQLPAPWQPGAQASSGDAASAGVVEFGQLDDEPAESGGVESGAVEIGAVEGESHSLNPDEQIELIERQVAAAREDEDFQPAGSIGPEVELTFHGPHDPFGQKFDEEEVVIDRYALLEEGGLRRRARFSSEEVRELAAALSSAVRNDAPNLAIAAETRQQSSQPNPAAQPHAARQPGPADFDPAHDPVMPEPPTDLQHGPRSTLEDDSDLIVLDDAREAVGNDSARAPQGRARRQEYRQLFAKLRKG